MPSPKKSSKVRRWLNVLTALSLLLAGCRESDPVPVYNPDYEYVPLAVGNWIEYEVDSIVYNSFEDSTEYYNYIVKDEVVESYEDLEGRTVYRVLRYQRADSNSAYSPTITYELLRDDNRIERKLNGKVTVPFVFPPQEGRTWDGNAFNTDERQDFEFDYVDQFREFNDVQYRGLTRIIQIEDTNNFVIKQFAEEIYADGIGLIYSYESFIETQFEIDSGLTLIRTRIASDVSE